MDQIPSTVVYFLLISVVIAGCTWFFQYMSIKRRHLQLLGKITKVPGLPIIGNALSLFGTTSEIFDLFVKYFFEYGPNFLLWFGNIPVVIIGKPEDLERTMQSQSCLSKGYFYEFTKLVVGEGLFSAPVHKWRKTRKIIQPTFNSKILNYFLPIFAETSGIFVNEILLRYVNRKDIDWFPLFSSVHLDTISQTAMGMNTDAQRRKTNFVDHLNTALRITFFRMTNVFLHPDIIFKFTRFSAEVNTAVKFMKKFTNERDLENRPDDLSFGDEPSKRKVFLEFLLELDHKGNKFTDQELIDEVMTFFVGGTDTSAVTSCFFLSMMGMHQDIQQRVFEEILEVIGPEKSADVEDLTKLQLLERCLKETLRIFPPAPFIAREVKDKEVKLTDYVLPVGTVLLFSIFYTHRCPDYWENPLKFDPDRFLPEVFSKKHPYSFIPFSGGLRNCVGIRYSYMNLKNLLSMILRKYKVYCDYKSIEEIELENCIVVKPIHGFKIHFEERR
ncbi:hypothetical protein HHI36_004537 [Cryptolaemus montrouzieri]|uniref:Cytochrome P450 n=1 Tax=Cryptolaemus montrouzieri TaxID=559131 RepID=A0ABD2NRH5_9CUCU